MSEVVRQRAAYWWSGFLWGVIGFAYGTVITSPFVLSIDRRDRLIGGMIFGGILFGALGLAYGLRRASRPTPPSWRQSVSLLGTACACLLAIVCLIYVVAWIAEPGLPDQGPIAIVVLVTGVGASLLFIGARQMRRRDASPEEEAKTG